MLAVAIAFDSMTDQELQETGLAKLTIQERMNLREWIEEHYVKNIVQNKAKLPIIQEVLKRGKYVRLSDGSLWEIDPQDTPITQSWITPSEIKIDEIKIDKSIDSDYPYSLTNSLTGSSVRARKAQRVTN